MTDYRCDGWTLQVRQQVIYAEGTSGTDMYMLLSGELEITMR